MDAARFYAAVVISQLTGVPTATALLDLLNNDRCKTVIDLAREIDSARAQTGQGGL